MAAAAPSGSKFVHLFKRGWKEIPEVMASSVLAVIGVGLGIIGMNMRMNLKPEEIMRTEYVVYREDDPLAEPFKKNKST